MLYCNCHYRYKDQLCELVGFLPNIGNGGRKVRIRLRNDKEVICSENDLEEIPLTESILQSCYKMKTIVRDEEWDVLWHLGGNPDTVIGEKNGRYHLIPSNRVNETVIDILPEGLIQGSLLPITTSPYTINTLSRLEHINPNLFSIIRKGKSRLFN